MCICVCDYLCVCVRVCECSLVCRAPIAPLIEPHVLLLLQRPDVVVALRHVHLASGILPATVIVVVATLLTRHDVIKHVLDDGLHVAERLEATEVGKLI